MQGGIAVKMRSLKTKAQRDLFRQEVTDGVIKLLEKGESAWTRPWTQHERSNLPHNGVTGRFYRGCNVMWLSFIAMAQEYKSNEWGTYKQWQTEHARMLKKQGVNVEQRTSVTSSGKERKYWWNVDDNCAIGAAKKGEKAHPAILFKPLKITEKDDDDNETFKVIPLMRAFPVFNRNQTVLPDRAVKATDNEPRDITDWEHDTMALVEAHGVDYREGGDRAFFNYRQDYVQVPVLEAFKSAEGRVATILHEVTHWTGHPSRLDRDIDEGFGSLGYAREELVAEMGSAMLSAYMGIPQIDLENHASYIQTWANRLKEKDGHNYLFRASSAAQKAVDYLMETKWGDDAEAQ